MIILLGWQVRACPATLKLSIEELARRSGVSERSIRRIEAQDGPVKNATTDLMSRLAIFFENEGFTFTEMPGSRGSGLIWKPYAKRSN